VAGLVGTDAVIIDDPLSGPLRVKQTQFSRWWKRNGNLCVLIAAAAERDERLGTNR